MTNPVRPEKIAEVEQRLEKLGVRKQDIQEKFVRSQGPGGQKVNKTSTAVYIKHLPTGIEIKIQTSRSQALNRFLARRKLAIELEAIEQKQQNKEDNRIARIRKQKQKRAKRTKIKLDEKRQKED